MEMTACGASSLFFAAVGDFVPVFGVFSGCFVAVGDFVLVLGGFPGRFVACGGILSWFLRCFRDVLLLRRILSRFWGHFRDVLSFPDLG